MSHPKEWEIFCQIDEDNSGTLDTEELFLYLADMEEDIANELMQELSGQSSGVLIDFANFVVGWKKVFSCQQAARVQPIQVPPP